MGEGRGIYSVAMFQKEGQPYGCPSFWVSAAESRLLPFLKCSGEVNSPCAKVLGRRPKTLVRRKGAAPPCGAPCPTGIHTVSIVQKEGHPKGCPSFWVSAAKGRLHPFDSNACTAQKRRPTLWGPIAHLSQLFSNLKRRIRHSRILLFDFNRGRDFVAPPWFH